MPGFVDVSGMSYQDVKRMGQMDDDVDYQPRRPYASRPKQVPQIEYAVSDVWAAACAAQRVNGDYYKEPVWSYPEGQKPVLQTRRNRDVMMEFLDNPDRILVEDVENGERVRNFLQNDLTFRAVKGQLTEFDSSVSKCLAVLDRFGVATHRYELAVVACLPNSVVRAEQRQNVEARVQFAQGGLVGTVGSKVQLNDVEVLSCHRSKEFNIYWIKGITDKDQVVLFSNKEAYDVGTHLTIQGKVKAHKNDLTQLNYVKVL